MGTIWRWYAEFYLFGRLKGGFLLAMRIFTKRTLREFWEKYPDAEKSLKAWHREVEGEKWSKPQELTARYSKASIVGDNRAVFRIKHNRYRLVAKINYCAGMVYVRFIGTHEQYDLIDAEEV